MNGTEIIEELTGIVAQQSHIIGKLYETVRQLNAVTTLDEEIAAVQAKAASYAISPEE